VNAGASALLDRQSVARRIDGGPNISSNIAIPTLRAGGRTVYLLPDRVLVKDGRTYADVDYPALRVTSTDERFIESGSVPSDAVTVDTTWQYVNKGGGPDRRFKDNRRLPILRYGRVDLESAAGLRVRWQFSTSASASAFAQGIRGLQGRRG
jgi:hypothetical protein